MTDAENFAHVLLEIYSTGLPPPMARQSLVGQGLVMVKPSRSHTYPPHSAGLFWTSDQTISTDRHTYHRRDSKPQSHQVSDLRQRGHWDRPGNIYRNSMK